MRKIVILGAGFAGLHALHHLERALSGRRRVELTLITDQPHFLFSPLLPNVANSELTLRSITVNLQDHISSSTRLVVDRIVDVDLDRRVLVGEQGVHPFDYLLLAPGAQTDWRGHEDWKPHALTCKSSKDAILIKETIDNAIVEAAQMSPERRKRHLTFTFAGCGPTGVELAAELHAALTRDVFPNAPSEIARDTRFILADPGDRILPGLPDQLAQTARQHLERVGFEFRLGERVVDRQADSVGLSNGDTIHCDHFFWCAGVKPSTLLSRHDRFEHDPTGRVLVDASLQALGHEGIFVAGDCAATPTPSPQTAQIAKQQGPIAAQNLVAALSGRAPKKFSPKHMGDMVTLGRGNAAVNVMGMTLEGLPAYAMYRVAYAGLMPNAMKKLRILAEWLEHDLNTQGRDDLPKLEH